MFVEWRLISFQRGVKRRRGTRWAVDGTESCWNWREAGLSLRSLARRASRHTRPAGSADWIARRLRWSFHKCFWGRCRLLAAVAPPSARPWSPQRSHSSVRRRCDERSRSRFCRPVRSGRLTRPCSGNSPASRRKWAAGWKTRGLGALARSSLGWSCTRPAPGRR